MWREHGSYGMPFGPPSQSPAPKSAWILRSTPIERMIAAESGATGSVSTRWLVENEAGKSGQPASVAAAVDDRGEHHAGSIGRAPGRVNVTASPPPGAAAAATLPPWRSATWRTIASPRPEPARSRAFPPR